MARHANKRGAKTLQARREKQTRRMRRAFAWRDALKTSKLLGVMTAIWPYSPGRREITVRLMLK